MRHALAHPLSLVRGRTSVRRALAALVGVSLALGGTGLGVRIAAGHSPTVGASRGSFPDLPDQVVPYRWGASTYPSWVTGAAGAALDGYTGTNNSRGPRPVYSSGGSAIVSYTATTASPCSSVTNLQWLQCATNGGTGSFRIHIRNFDGAPYGDWRWLDKTGSCLTSSGTRASGCWLVARAMIHEAGHAIPTFGHDAQTEAETVMRSTSPQVGAVGGDRRTFQRCDEAALQLLWSLANLAGAYADCLDHIGGAVASGLVTRLTTSATAYRGCTGGSATAAGRLATAADNRYLKLSDSPLAGRVVWFDRKRRVDTTWLIRAESAYAGAAASGPNWSRSFVSPNGSSGTWDYRAHFDGDRSLAPTSGVTFSITWSTSC